MTTSDGPRVQFVMPPSFPQEFLNWICTWSYSLKGYSIRFLDDWWTWFIESQLLYSQWDNWVTLRANWLLCYGMHHGKLSKLPGAWTASPELRLDIMLLPWNIWWPRCHYRKWLAFLISLFLFRLKASRSGVYNKSSLWIQSAMTRHYFVCWRRKPERFQNIMINNSFGEWNYCSACSFLVNWLLEEKCSHNVLKAAYFAIGLQSCFDVYYVYITAI